LVPFMRRKDMRARGRLASQQATAHITSADDALGDLDGPLDITPPAHETFQDDIGSRYADDDFAGFDIAGRMKGAFHRSARRRIAVTLSTGLFMPCECWKAGHRDRLLMLVDIS
jgi:hypothetical protein